MTFERTASENKDFLNLVALLDEDLARRDGEDHAFYAQFDTLDHIKNVVVGYQGNYAVGCGALQHRSELLGSGQRLKLAELAAAKSQGRRVLPAKVPDLADDDVVIARVHQLVNGAIEPGHARVQSQALAGLPVNRHARKALGHGTFGKLVGY